MYYLLKAQYSLRGWKRLPWALVDREKCSPVFLSRQDMQALQLCNGQIDLELPLIPQAVQERLPVLEKAGVIARCDTGCSLEPGQAYHCYPVRYIQAAHWSLTGRCNYRCKHCYMAAPDAKFGELEHGTMLSVVAQLSECGIRNVSLTGGEPLVRRDFWEIVDALLEKGIRITAIYSNGKLVTDSFLDALEARKIRPELNMSYDGIGFHDWLRGVPGAEKAVEEAFRRCRERGIRTSAEMCIARQNAPVMAASIRRLAQWGCGCLKVNPISNVGLWAAGGYGEAISREELYRLYLEYIPWYYADGMPLELQLGGFFWASPRIPERYDIPLQKRCDDPEKTGLCDHARTVLYISPEGRALPCTALSGMAVQETFPLIPEIGLVSCLTESPYTKFLDSRAAEYFAQNPSCERCPYAKQCIGGCRAAAWQGDPASFWKPDPYACELFRGGWIPRIHAAAQRAIHNCQKTQ